MINSHYFYMNLRFWQNFLLVLAILGLTIFSLVSFNDESMKRADVEERNYAFFLQIVESGRSVVAFLENPVNFIRDGIKTREAERAIEEFNPAKSFHSESLNMENASVAEDWQSLKEAMDNLRDIQWLRQDLPVKLKNTWQSYTQLASNLWLEKGFFYERSEENDVLGWRDKDGDERSLKMLW